MNRILVVVNSSKVNGTEKVVIDIVNNIDSKLFEVFLAIPENGDINCKILNKNVRIVEYGNIKMNKFNFTSIVNLYNLIKKIKPNLVNSHCSPIPCYIAKVFNNIKTVETRHGIHYDNKNLINLSLIIKLKEFLKYYFIDEISVISNSDKELLIKYLNYKNEKITVINNAFNNDIYKVIKKNTLSDNFKICSVGRLVKEKNHLYMIEIFYELLKIHPKFHLTIIGSGPEKNNIQNAISNYNLTEKITMINYTNKVLDIISQNNIFLLTSKYEGVPLSVLDALALGLPVISTNVGSIKDVVKDNFNGFTINIDLKELFLKKILYLAENKETFLKFTVNAKNSVKNFTVEKMVKDYENLYLKLLNKS
ncbi:MAG TPA: glycosyltransferase [Ignavibacteria bacterium]|nr:glycosyltransferase [Ignavibacteria bacterium]